MKVLDTTSTPSVRKHEKLKINTSVRIFIEFITVKQAWDFLM